MDKRLKNMQQADLTESRVNDDFVYWLKTWGSNILIVILVIAAAGMGYQWWEQRKAQERDSAWSDLNEARLPAALLDVAQAHGDKDSVALYAELTAADTYMSAINRGIRFDREAGAADAALTPDVRAEWLKEADRLYEVVASKTASSPELGKKLMHVGALFGRASVAEDRKDFTAAEGFLKQVQAYVKGADGANMAQIADARIARLQELGSEIEFISVPRADLSTPTGLAPAPMLGTDQSSGLTAPAATTPAGTTAGAKAPVLPPEFANMTEAEAIARGLVKNANGEWVQRVKGATIKLTPTEADPANIILPGADNVDTHEQTLPPKAPTPGPLLNPTGTGPAQPKPPAATPPASTPPATPPTATPPAPPASAPPAATPPASTPPVPPSTPPAKTP